MRQRPRIRISRPTRPPNRFSRLKLPGSKWTDLQPHNQEKHFVVHDWAEAQSEELEIEAVQSHRFFKIHWKALKNAEKWQMGWH
ncbi:MAG: TIGR02450 family Trp-rich protein [Candidatus Sericytochromatia bacterium]